jgi:hypothetical protein
MGGNPDAQSPIGMFAPTLVVICRQLMNPFLLFPKDFDFRITVLHPAPF